jgi:hypothetical protein
VHGELGRSGMNVSKICLGTMHFGLKDGEESHAILTRRFPWASLTTPRTCTAVRLLSGPRDGRIWFPPDRACVMRPCRPSTGRWTAIWSANNHGGFSAYKVRAKDSCVGCRRTGSTFTKSTTSTNGCPRKSSGEDERIVADTRAYGLITTRLGSGQGQMQPAAWLRVSCPSRRSTTY